MQKNTPMFVLEKITQETYLDIVGFQSTTFCTFRQNKLSTAVAPFELKELQLQHSAGIQLLLAAYCEITNTLQGFACIHSSKETALSRKLKQFTKFAAATIKDEYFAVAHMLINPGADQKNVSSFLVNELLFELYNQCSYFSKVVFFAHERDWNFRQLLEQSKFTVQAMKGKERIYLYCYCF